LNIVIDAMGGDYAPTAPVEGAIAALKGRPGLHVTLVGKGELILETLRELGYTELPQGLELRNAEEVIEICDDPSNAFRKKKDSSMTVGLTMVKQGEGDAFVCAGSTGALLSAATLLVGRIRGIRRAAMAPVIPTVGKGAILIDCGANADCTPEYLLQFAYMGSFCAQQMMGLDKPRVGLLNIGAEPSKGTDLQREAHALLTAAGEAGRIHFIGNVEAKEAITQDMVDVIVTDGYAGNIFLKTLEGTGSMMGKEIKGVLKSSALTKLAAMMIMKPLKAFMKKADGNEVGGTPFIGIAKTVIKAHGSANARGFENAIYQAANYAGSALIGDIEANIDDMKI
jgi:fatty acid/phospholipid synthesis protein PlsX